MHFAPFFETVALVFEFLGVAAMAIGFIVAVVVTLSQLRREHNGANAFRTLRTTFGSSILLGLEILVAADLIKTITSWPAMSDVLALGIIVLIRTVLSVSIQVEIDGVWPWRRALFTSGGQQLGEAVATEVRASRAAPPAA
jgi:uncharacterized membrane protein